MGEFSVTGRVWTEDVGTVFFESGEALDSADTDGGYVDVYEWSAGGGVRLVSAPGGAPYGSYYVDNSADGGTVFFVTSEPVLAQDVNASSDIYAARVGGGFTLPPPPSECVADGCQGPPSGPLAGVAPTSAWFQGPGNRTAPARPSVSVARTKAVTGPRATLRVKVSGAGSIVASGRSVRRASRLTSRATTYVVRVSLTAVARRALRRQGSSRVSVRVTFKPRSGRAVVKTVALTFKRPKGGR